MTKSDENTHRFFYNKITIYPKNPQCCQIFMIGALPALDPPQC